jgi:hypothetical protein
MANWSDESVADYSALQAAIHGLQSQVESLRESLEHAVREFQNQVDALAVSKVAVRQVDLLWDENQCTKRRTDMLESRVQQLVNRCTTIEHTSFKVDPDSVMPLLQPLSDRIELLEYDLALRNDDQVRACGAQAADQESSLAKLRAQIDAMQ